MGDTLLDIKNWLKTLEVEEPLENKSRDRVHTIMAKQIRNNKPLTGGACNLCGSYDDKLVPVIIRSCLECCKKFIRNTGNLTVIEKKTGPYYCDTCFNNYLITMQINPRICRKCVKELGGLHKRKLPEMKKQKQREAKQKLKRIGKSYRIIRK